MLLPHVSKLTANIMSRIGSEVNYAMHDKQSQRERIQMPAWKCGKVLFCTKVVVLLNLFCCVANNKFNKQRIRSVWKLLAAETSINGLILS